MTANDQQPIVLVDLDGTLADVRHRLPFIHSHGQKKDWKRFFEAMDEDPPVKAIVQRVQRLAGDYSIVIVTGRPEEFRKRTIAWLARYEVPWDEMYMRPQGDHRPDYVVKKEMLDTMGEARSRIVMVIDDRPSVCDMWRREGLNCQQVGIEGDW